MRTSITRIVLGATSCYLIRHEGAVFVDCGDARREGAFRRALAALPEPAPQIRLILLTHGHADHAGSAAAIARLTGAPVAIHARDRAWLEQGVVACAKGHTAWGRVLSRLMRLAEPLFRFQPVVPDVVIGDEGLSLAGYGIPGRVVPTPGHTWGSVSVLLEDGSALVGCLGISGFPALSRRPALPFLADDMGAVLASWRRLLAEGITTVYPGHGKPFPAEVIRAIVEARR